MAKKTTTPLKKPAAVKRPATRRTKRADTKPLDEDVQVQAILLLDFPQLEEQITSPQYTLRFTAPSNVVAVDVSIDDSDWQPARYSIGHWWFDWYDYLRGDHRLRARAIGPDSTETFVERQIVVASDEGPRL
jgi:hypothetical protein